MISKKLARLATTAALGVAAVAAPIAVAGSAGASTAPAAARPAAVHEVCANSLYVRSSPGGLMIGTLFRGDHFDYYYSNGNGWDYGYAYGGANTLGWVQAGWFC
ncbi:MAG: hypothetical protein V7637_3707 [Mycobacteriales bacterium]|jgi:hypothetical protein